MLIYLKDSVINILKVCVSNILKICVSNILKVWVNNILKVWVNNILKVCVNNILKICVNNIHDFDFMTNHLIDWFKRLNLYVYYHVYFWLKLTFLFICNGDIVHLIWLMGIFQSALLSDLFFMTSIYYSTFQHNIVSSYKMSV